MFFKAIKMSVQVRQQNQNEWSGNKPPKMLLFLHTFFWCMLNQGKTNCSLEKWAAQKCRRQTIFYHHVMYVIHANWSAPSKKHARQILCHILKLEQDIHQPFSIRHTTANDSYTRLTAGDDWHLKFLATWYKYMPTENKQLNTMLSQTP